MEEGKRRWGRRSRFARVKNWERPEGGTSSAVDETGDELFGGNQDNDADDDVDVDDGGGDDDDDHGGGAPGGEVVTYLEWDAELMARDVEIVIGGVREVRSVVILNQFMIIANETLMMVRCV